MLSAACSGDDKGGTDTETTESSTSGDSTTTDSTTTANTTATVTTETSTSGSTDSTAGTDSTSEGTTAGTTSSTTEDTTEGTTEGTTGVMDVCPPREEASFRFKIEPEPEFVEMAVEWVCKVLEVKEGEQGERSFVMGCTEGDVAVEPSPTLVIEAKPAPALVQLQAGSALRIFYYQAAPWWLERWIRVEDLVSGDLLIAGIDGVSFNPSDMVTVTAPVELSAPDGACTPLEGDCGVIERLQLEAMAEGVMTTHLDGTFAIAGGDPGFSVWVEGAARFVGQIECTDTPERWYTLGVIADGQE